LPPNNTFALKIDIGREPEDGVRAKVFDPTEDPLLYKTSELVEVDEAVKNAVDNAVA
jgi:hypothetical protein